MANQQAQQGLQYPPQHALLHQGPNLGQQPAAGQGQPQASRQHALLHAAQQHAGVLPRTGPVHALSASHHALPPWWSDPFASASAAAVAAAGSSADYAAAYISSMAGRGAVRSSADPGGAPANSDVIQTRGVRLCGRMKAGNFLKVADRPGQRPSSTASGSSAHGQAVGSMDPSGAPGAHNKPASNRHDTSSASPVNRPFTRHARNSATNAAANNPDSGGDAHAQVVRQLLASRNCSKAGRASDVAAAGGQAAQPGYGESAAPVSTAAFLTAQPKPDDTASLLPAESAPHSPPTQSPRPRDWFMEEHRQEVHRVCRGRFRTQPDGLSPRADTTASAKATVVAATARLASMTPAVSLAEHHTSSNTLPSSHSCPQTNAAAPKAQGGLQDNLMGSQEGSRIIPLSSEGGMPDSGSLKDVPSGSGRVTKDDPSGCAAAMPPPAPRQPAETAADAADLLWSPSSHNRDMHSLGAGLLDLPDPSEDRPRKQRFKPHDPSGSETTQSFRHALQQAVAKEPLDMLFPDGLTDWGTSSSADKATSLSGKMC